MKDELTEIRGIGDAKAEAVMEVVESNSVDSDVAENVRRAYDYYQDGQEHQALSFLERAYELLKG